MAAPAAEAYGPTFGGGHDFYTTFSGGSCSFGHSYTCRVGSYPCGADFCGSSSTVSISEMEVYYR